MKVIIATPAFTLPDAVSYDAWMQYASLKKLGIKAFLYAEHPTPPGGRGNAFASIVRVKHLIKQPENLLIYHHSVYWHLGAYILRAARCKVIIKHHNITPPEYFESWDPPSLAATRLGYQQTNEIINLSRIRPLDFCADSHYSKGELIRDGVDPAKTSVIPPFVNSFHLATQREDVSVKQQLQNGDLHILSVGRIVPNKNHLGQLKVLKRYVERYDGRVKLHFVGSLTSVKRPYLQMLIDFINANNLGPFVRFTGKVTDQELHTYYKNCGVFLLLSHHEGFCVPIIESQSHGLPIVGLARTACAETMGPNQLTFENEEPGELSAALRVVGTHQETRSFLKERGYANCEKYSEENIQKCYSDLLINKTKAL